MADTTLTLDDSTKDRLDDAAPPGASWDDRLNALLDAVEDGSDGDTASTEDVERAVDGLRDDLLAQLPSATAREVHERRR